MSTVTFGVRSALQDEYLAVAKRIYQRVESEPNPQAKEILQDIARSFRRLAELEEWLAANDPNRRKYDRPSCLSGSIAAIRN
jgi:hypothetical protein